MTAWTHHRTRSIVAGVAIAMVAVNAGVDAWGTQGHRLVALVAVNHLTTAARESVKALLGDESLADVAVWADAYLAGNNQTSYWHYVNIPAGAASYDRARDCPRQPGVSAGGRGDNWRDCVVDRIRYNRSACRIGVWTVQIARSR